MSQFFIPEEIDVGYQNRQDTYTGKLAYVTYYKDNKLMKEKSWNGWRDKNITNTKFKNEPIEGFVLNKKVGGYKSDWNYRRSMIRIYDPRDFEFEISIENLLFILENSTCDKGKGLEGKFVYSWCGKDLILLPVESNDYKNCVDFTKAQNSKFSAKELVPGRMYETKSQEHLLYLGRFSSHFGCIRSYSENKKSKKYHIFIDPELERQRFEFVSSMSKFSRCISEDIHDKFPDLVEMYENSVYSSDIKSLYLVDKINDEYTASYDKDSDSFIIINKKKMKKVAEKEESYGYSYRYDLYSYLDNYSYYGQKNNEERKYRSYYYTSFRWVEDEKKLLTSRNNEKDFNRKLKLTEALNTIKDTGKQICIELKNGNKYLFTNSDYQENDINKRNGYIKI